ncbi:MAG: XRE family transcriptional regulator [Pseudomonadota bacterium]
MTLDDYLASNRLTLEAFGLRVNASAPTVSRWRSGVLRPPWGAMDRILEVTDGEVTPNDFAKIERKSAA